MEGAGGEFGDSIGAEIGLTSFLLQMKQSWANEIPLFLGHGTADPVIR